MKLFVASLVAAVLVGTAVANDEAAPLRGGEERLLGEGDFDYLKVYYNPKGSKGPRCFLKYKLKGASDEERVDFSKKQIREGTDRVYCTKSVSPVDGVDLPIDVDLPLHRATWVSEVVRDADVKWSKDNKKLEVAIKRFKAWSAEYDPEKEDICTLEYTFREDKYTEIDFKKSEVKVNGDEVTCKTRNVSRRLPISNGLKKLRKEISKYHVKWADSDVKGAVVTWKKGAPLKLVIKRNYNPTGKEAFREVDLNFDQREDTVVFTYTLKGEERERKIVFKDVEEDDGKVDFSTCAEPPENLKLPVEFTFDRSEVKWVTKCGKKEAIVVVDTASFFWEESISCAAGGDDRRRLRKKGRAGGDIKAKGS